MLGLVALVQEFEPLEAMQIGKSLLGREMIMLSKGIDTVDKVGHAIAHGSILVGLQCIPHSACRRLVGCHGLAGTWSLHGCRVIGGVSLVGHTHLFGCAFLGKAVNRKGKQ